MSIAHGSCNKARLGTTQACNVRLREAVGDHSGRDAEAIPGGSGDWVEKLQTAEVPLDTIPRFWPNAE